MILGVGNDIIRVARLARSIDGLGEPFLRKILSDHEFDGLPALGRAERVAKLFTAKEACSKALGTGMSKGVHWRDIEVDLPRGILLKAGARHRLNAITGDASDGQLLLDTYCDGTWAGATVILSGANFWPLTFHTHHPYQC